MNILGQVMVLFLTQMMHHKVINEKGSQNTLKLTLWNPLKRRGSGIASTEGRRGSAPLRQSRSRGVAHLGRMVKFMKFRISKICEPLGAVNITASPREHFRGQWTDPTPRAEPPTMRAAQLQCHCGTSSRRTPSNETITSHTQCTEPES